MIIKSIGLKNFKSYGNNKQTVHFKNGGELILLSGDNETGKSSLIEAIDFTLYNTVRGKNTKKIAITKLPNRINKNLETDINFINDNNDDIIIRKKIEPNSIEVFKNNSSYLNEFKVMSSDDRDKFIGLDYNTYRSLISLNLSDFANFINLDTDTKKKLLNKLFDINEIDEYHSIAKETVKNLYKEKEKIENLIISNNKTLNTYKDNIINITNQISNSSSKNDIKDELLSLKNIYLDLNKNISNINDKINDLTKQYIEQKKLLEVEKNNLIQNNYTLSELSKKLDIYNSGICPVCNSILESNNQHLDTEKINLDSNIVEIKSKCVALSIIIKKLSSDLDNLKNDLNEKTNDINNIDFKLKFLKKQYDINNETDRILLIEIEKNINNLESENIEFDNNLKKIKIDISKYEKIVNYLSENGIRKNIIQSIVNPINEHLEFYLKEIQSKHNVKLNNEFDAIIKERYIEIDPETLSIGGARKINIAIALSYLKILLKRNKKINIMFLDDVFSAISPSNINIILKVLKNFAIDNNINIVIVHQIDFDTNMFDRIIHIEKDVFSIITEKN